MVTRQEINELAGRYAEHINATLGKRPRPESELSLSPYRMPGTGWDVQMQIDQATLSKWFAATWISLTKDHLPDLRFAEPGYRAGYEDAVTQITSNIEDAIAEVQCGGRIVSRST